MEDYIFEELLENDFEEETSKNFYKFVEKADINLNFPLIHVCGSNGKSLTARILNNIYCENEYTSALFLTNQHNFESMIFFNNKPLKREEIESIFNQHKKLFKKFDLSKLEVMFAIFLFYIQEKKIDIVIVEAGNEGFEDFSILDYENKLLTIITSNSLTHTDILGTTTSEITDQHSAFISENSKVLIPQIEETSEIIIRNAAKKLDSDVFVVDSYYFAKVIEGKLAFDYRPFKGIVINSLADYLIKVACLAIVATQLLNNVLPIKEESLKKALLKKLEENYFYIYKNYIFDLADNVEAAREMVVSLRRTGGVAFCLFASDKNSNISAILPLINNFIDHIIISRLDDLNLKEEADYFLYLGDYSFAENPYIAMKVLLENDPEAKILITGNKDFVNQIREEIEEWKRMNPKLMNLF